jgi:glycosyltransferase involved in cell wall biosynthesis
MHAQQLASQDYPLFKIFIVDSASTDGTLEALRALPIAGLHVLQASSAAYWTEATNRGVVRALEEGCDYILTLNDDTIFPVNLVNSLVTAAEAANERLVGSVICYANEPGRIWGIGAYNDWRDGAFLQTGQANLWEDALRQGTTECGDNLIKVEGLCGNGTLIHKSVFEKIGLYDRKHTPHYHADAEFTMRASRMGIHSWVARDARLYNRFTEEADGPLASKNIRFFSLRSANYIRPILYILQEYCPPEERVNALCRYLGRYLPTFKLRERSKLLRAIGYLCHCPQSEGEALGYFLPPLDSAMIVAEDFDILRRLPPRELVAAAYMYLLRRTCSDGELNGYMHALLSGKTCDELLLEMVGSEEYQNLPEPLPLMFMMAAASGFKPQNLADIATDSEFAVLAFTSSKKRLPTRREFDLGRNLLDATGRSGLLSEYGVAYSSLVNFISDGNSSDIQRLTVYMNIDVLCMAVLDPRARTGVHRYVSAIARALARDSRVNLQVFYSPQVEQQWTALTKTDPAFASMKAAATRVMSGAIVFYPYFPLEGPDVRYTALPTFIMLHDLFPLTNPEWFTPEASHGFRRQTRILVDADHIFCNSDATRRQLMEVFPSLKATSSTAHLAADLPPHAFSAVPSSDRQDGTRYFLCVGTLEPRKNLENVLRAFNLLQQDQALTGLDMFVVGQVGWNLDESRLSELVGQHSTKIKFLGNVGDAELRGLYLGAACTVFPSLAEGFGLPILESFACGVPVVTSNGSSMAEIANGGAILVNPHDPSEIAAAIRRITTDPELRGALGLAAKSHAANFTWTKCAEAHIVEFERVVRRCYGAGVRLAPAQ